MDKMRLFPISSSSDSSPVEQSNSEKSQATLYLNIYDLTPLNNYFYWFGCGIFHSGIEELCAKLREVDNWYENGLKFAFSRCARARTVHKAKKKAHGLEYGFGAHEYPTSGVFEVEPRSCPGFIFRRSILLGNINMSRSEFRSFMEHLSNKYHGDTYNLISKNCNHFTDEVCQQLTGQCIPGWVNRLARLGSFCSCLLPENIQATSVTHLPDLEMLSDDGAESCASSAAGENLEEDLDHHLLTTPNSDVALLKDKPVKLAKDIL